MSQGSDPETPLSPGVLGAAMGLYILRRGQAGPLEFPAAQGLVVFNDALYELEKEIADANVDDEKNVEQQQQAFMGLPPPGDVVDDNDNVFSVGAESQFSDSTPRAAGDPGPNLQQKLTTLCALRDSLKSQILANGEGFFQWLRGFASMSLQFSDREMQIYGNHPLVAGPEGQSMLVPMLSFYGIATKEIIPRIKHKNNIDSITKNIIKRVRDLFTTPLKIPEFSVDCPEPTLTNLVWNVRLTLNGNIFILLTFRIVAMTKINFSPQVSPLSPQNLFMLLCFALLSKACAKDFNCLCGMPDIDVELFKLIYVHPLQLEQFSSFFKIFLTALAEPQLDSKRSYMITALHNLVSNIVDTSQTGETLAYKRLFDSNDSGSGANTFNPIMRQITQLIQILRPLPLGLELQVSLCGGRMIYKLGDVLRKFARNPVAIAALGGLVNAEALVGEMLKPLNSPSDADYTLTFAGLGSLIPYLQDPGFVQTLLMFFTLCSQLGIKKTIDEFCTSHKPYAAFFLKGHAVIGMSLVGGDFQLSSTRSSCDALAFLDAINVVHGPPFLNDFLRQFPRDPNRPTKSSLAEFDLVPKMLSGDYIKKIAGYVFGSGYVNSKNKKTTKKISQNIKKIANRISRYSMSTDEGFSSPVKVLFDIFFTLFSIENFTNRAFVTQKINKELKRIAICASILFFHFNELLPEYAVGTEQHTQITTMLQILGNVINYGYNPIFKLLSTEIHPIMTAYASCFVQLLHLYHLGVVFYSRVPDATLPAIGPRTTLTSLETDCMNMIEPAYDAAQAEGLLHPHLQDVITTGVGFLHAIQGNSILASLLQIKENVKAQDLTYKTRGEFLTSVEAFDLFLRDFVPMLVSTTLVAQLDPLLRVFRGPVLGLAELMHFQPIVVIKSENLLDPVDAADLQGLKVSGEYQFGVYVILSIFGVKFKSEWSKISLFTRMLFYQLLSRGLAMRNICLTLLGVDLNKVDPSKMRVSSENFMKDQALFLTLQPCGVVLPPPLQTYYGSDKLHHGIDTYRNGLLDTREVTHSFIHPSDYNRDEDVLSFQFLNSENLGRLMGCLGEDFQRLLPDGFQPRAYEFLLQRLTDKFSILTKECDEILRQELYRVHGGRSKKDFRSQVKVQELDTFIDSFVTGLLSAGQITPEQINQLIISQLISSTEDACFEGKEDDVSKFRELEPDQRRYWLDHLMEMIRFFKNPSVSHAYPELCKQNITKYSKLLFLLKKYLIPKPTQPGLLELTPEQLSGALASLFQPPPEPQEPVAREPRPSRGRSPSPSEGNLASPGRSRSRSPSRSPSIKPTMEELGGGSPKASKTKPKTRNNNRYSKNARTRRHKHKRKQHRNRKNKKTKNKKSNRRTKSKSKKNVTFKRRRR